MYLGDPQVNFKFLRPGALYQARWMAKILYSIKLLLVHKKLNSILPESSKISVEQLEKLQRFANFAVLVYIPWWMKSPLVADAPFNDLKLLRSISNYTSIDKQSSAAAMKTLSWHLWYLTEELVPLYLFSNEMDDLTVLKKQ